MDFHDKVVLITGAGAGIGQAAAVRYAECGARVAASTLTPSRGEKTLELIRNAGGADSAFIQGDVSSTADALRIVRETVERFGRVDILVNNAGIVAKGAVDGTSEEDFDKTMAVNVKSVFMMSKFAAPHMLRQGGGVIVNVGSSVALKGVADRAAYSASKGAVVALTRAMAVDYMKKNIRVNCVCPGTTMTPSLQERINAFPDPAQALRDFTARQPMGRLGEAVELANAILFASWDGAAFMSGAIIAVDGGMTC